MYTINCKGKLLVIDQPWVMGIINATPDSFFEGHLTKEMDSIVKLAGTMLADGAAMLDIGGQSTKPGSKKISAEEEINRVIPVIEAIAQQYPEAIISVDTFYSTVAVAAVKAGASIVNDISGGTMDDDMLNVVADLKTPFICMHMQGTPETMQQQTTYQYLITDVLDYLSRRVDSCRKAGINDVIVDPGFGFGKTIQQNFQLLKNLSAFTILDTPLLVGLSRKSTIYKTLNLTAAEALNGTTSLNTLALLNGASILRVHDVKEAWQAIQLVEAYKRG
jgi:dihydropteroate synthase